MSNNMVTCCDDLEDGLTRLYSGQLSHSTIIIPLYYKNDPLITPKNIFAPTTERMPVKIYMHSY